MNSEVEVTLSMRMNDYEKGLPRGGGRSGRAVFGRYKWFMLILLIVNVFLIYKLWDTSAELSMAKKSSKSLMYEVSQAETKHNSLMQELNSVNKKFSDLLRSSREKDSSSIAKLQNVEKERDEFEDRNEELRRELAEMENAVQKFEKCSQDLKGVQEFAESLKKELSEAKEERQKAMEALGEQGKQIPRNDEEESEKQPAKTVGVVNEIKTGEEEAEKEEAGKEEDKKQAEEIINVDKEPDTVIQCDFSQSQFAPEKCAYHNVPDSDAAWTIGQSPTIDHFQENLEERTAVYLLMDDTKLIDGTMSGIFFDAFPSDSCIKLEVTLLLVGGASVNIADNRKLVASLPEKDAEQNWITKELILRKSEANHLIEIRAEIKDKGAVAISKILATPTTCPVEENPESDEEARPDASEDAVNDVAEEDDKNILR